MTMNYEIVEEIIVSRMGMSLSPRAIRNLTNYAYNIITFTNKEKDIAACEVIINGICSAAILGWEEL